MKLRTDIIILLFVLLFSSACETLNPQQPGTYPISHHKFTELLNKHVDDQGMVDYEGFANERERLNDYLQLLTSNAPNDSNWTKNDQIAYWINLYNAYTIALILEHYPVKSIKDIGSIINIPFVNSPWDIKFIQIGNKKYDLNNIEHNILRKRWNEPRIHFAVNCASMSCPKLMREAFEGDQLDRQLDEQARDFINDDFRNSISKSQVQLSRIFYWYEGDFTRDTSLKDYINQYAETKIAPTTELEFKPYSWALNVQED